MPNQTTQKNLPELSSPTPSPAEAHAGGYDDSNWLISYADMMTLLCGFFIMLFSMAKLDEPSYDAVKEALSKQFGGKYVSNSQDLSNFAERLVKDIGVKAQAVVQTDSKGVAILFQSTVFFESGSARITPEGLKVLDQLIESIKNRQTEAKQVYRLVIEGHTDSKPILDGAFESNWELSSARAIRVVRRFLGNRFLAKHLTPVGYSCSFPLAPERNPDGSWNEESLATNRRVVLRILEADAQSFPLAH